MDIEYDPTAKTMFISQANSVASLLERARMSDCNSTVTPCQAGILFSKKDCPEPPADARSCTEYRSLIALANFIACSTSPDITFTVNKLCKFMSNPGEVHWQALFHLLRDLKGTKSKGLFENFSVDRGDAVNGVHGYTDSSYADCHQKHDVFYYDGAILSWYSKLHTFVTTCTNHSEYAALALRTKEAQWMVYLFSQLEPQTKHVPVPLYVDNSGVESSILHVCLWDMRAVNKKINSWGNREKDYW